jgi:hypothetical protein
MMNKKAFLVTVILIVIISAVISMKITQIGHSNTQVHTSSSNISSPVTEPRSNISTTESFSTRRDAIFIGDGAPAYALLRMKDKIYALGGGVAVIFSEDLSPLCYAKLKYNIWKAENYDEDRFVSMQQWYSQPGSIAMFDSELNLIWSVDGNFTDFRVVNNKIYAIESRSGFLESRNGSYYLDIFDEQGNLIRSFKALDVKEIAGRTVIQYLLSIEVKDGKIYVPYVSGEAEGPYKLTLLRFDEQGNLELKKVIYEAKENMDRTYIYSYKDGLLLAIEGPIRRYIYTDREGNIVGKAGWKPPLEAGFRNCWGQAKVLNDRVYVFGHDECLFAGFVGLVDESSLYVNEYNESMYYTRVQEIVLQKGGTWQDNSVVHDILSDGDELYVIGIVQMSLPSGAFIVRVDPDLKVNINNLLEQADVVYLEDIPPCKS